jgi:hypothetical protein
MRWVRVLQDRPRSGASRCKSRKEHAQVSIDELKTIFLTLAIVYISSLDVIYCCILRF